MCSKALLVTSASLPCFGEALTSPAPVHFAHAFVRCLSFNVLVHWQVSRNVLSCGWPDTNTAFRSAICWAVIVLSVVMIVAVAKHVYVLLLWTYWLFLACAICMGSVLTLDTNSVRIGSGYCSSTLTVLPAGNSPDCLPLPFIGLLLMDVAAIVLLSLTFHFSRLCGKSFGSATGTDSAAAPSSPEAHKSIVAAHAADAQAAPAARPAPAAQPAPARVAPVHHPVPKAHHPGDREIDEYKLHKV
jgi:hypothetical protein